MIYPKPQKINFTSIRIKPNSIRFSGVCLDTAKIVSEQYNIPEGNDYQVELVIDNIHSSNNEKYYISISETGVQITANGKRGVFRGVHTLLKLIEKDELYCGEIEDYPLFKIRGYIEGFYGNTWKQEKRLSVMRLMAKYGMNTFYYAPKDDIYHREKWREEYPEKEYSKLKDLFNVASENELDFCWCIGPGLTYHYTDNKDFETLLNKIKSVYNIGVRSFGLLLDDIPWDFQYEDDSLAFSCIAEAHVKLVNDLYRGLKSFDKSISLTVCPTEYFGNENGCYISQFGQGIPEDVRLFWTGQEICSRVLRCRDTEDFISSTNHKPLFWDNYPVNDCEMFQEMHLGALIGRDKELYRYCDGLISNVMEYAECSKIPLMTIADYLWNPKDYCPEASLENAHKELLGKRAEGFKYIADHLCFSCLNRNGGSQLMSDKLSHIAFLNSTGKRKEALNEFSDYIEKMYACLEMLKDKSVPLFVELSKWTEKFELCCILLSKIYDTQLFPAKDNKLILADLLEKYNRDAVILTGFCLREAAEKTLKL